MRGSALRQLLRTPAENPFRADRSVAAKRPRAYQTFAPPGSDHTSSRTGCSGVVGSPALDNSVSADPGDLILPSPFKKLDL